ncbi:TPA: DUF922 domain-containing protein [Pseudomonas aeruginosa]|nr:DUF922 domain-containing protein [Pseudomonas aeruginosa]EKV3012637.1 DUF922 domain-containing protein [Pseudomonas aeruginosa]MBH3528397.1 DUF922 domain-containing protein [Pseudomonas aeruginosa]MBH4314815.1 DUF922 domain-containing protein [Pseudomonas aeruginosa]MBH8699630.1 DUF922 domain-containing protein [Pseudomonas aeruginosa]
MKRRALSWFGVCLSMTVMNAFGGGASPEVDFQIAPYEVRGRTLAEVQASIAENAPSHSGDAFYAGLTTWELRSTYDLATVEEGCRIDNGQVHLTIRVHLPVLVSPRLSGPAAAEWGRFTKALRIHEFLHAQNAHRAAKTLLGKLQGRYTDVPCSRAGDLVDRGTSTLIERIAQFDVELDASTRHGASDGAHLNTSIP